MKIKRYLEEEGIPFIEDNPSKDVYRITELYVIKDGKRIPLEELQPAVKHMRLNVERIYVPDEERGKVRKWMKKRE